MSNRIKQGPSGWVNERQNPDTPILKLGALLAAAGATDKVILVDSPEIFVGIKSYEPGEVFANHFHDGYDEFFAGLTGTVTVWQGRSRKSELAAGTSLLCPRGTHHYLVNDTDQPAQILFAKVPMKADDVTWVPWEPASSSVPA